MKAEEKLQQAYHFMELTKKAIAEAEESLSRRESRVRELEKVERDVVLSKTNAAQFLGISRPTLNKYLDLGKIKSLRFDHIHEYKQESK